MKKLTAFLAALLVSLSLVFTACGSSKPASNKKAPAKNSTKVTQQVGKNQPSFDLSSLPAFTNKPYVVLNHNVPDFPDKDKTKKSFERYSELDSLGPLALPTPMWEGKPCPPRNGAPSAA